MEGAETSTEILRHDWSEADIWEALTDDFLSNTVVADTVIRYAKLQGFLSNVGQLLNTLVNEDPISGSRLMADAMEREQERRKALEAEPLPGQYL